MTWKLNCFNGDVIWFAWNVSIYRIYRIVSFLFVCSTTECLIDSVGNRTVQGGDPVIVLNSIDHIRGTWTRCLPFEPFKSLTNLTQSIQLFLVSETIERRHLNLAIPVGTSGVHVPGVCRPVGKKQWTRFWLVQTPLWCRSYEKKKEESD